MSRQSSGVVYIVLFPVPLTCRLFTRHPRESWDTGSMTLSISIKNDKMSLGQLYRPNCRTKSKSWPPHLASSSISKKAQTNMFLSCIFYHLGDHPAPQIPCPKQSKPIAIAHLQHSKFAASVHFGQPKQGVPRGCRKEPNLKELLAIWFWLGTETVGTLETY